MTIIKRIGVLGGTFDPVHIGHLQMARNAMETFHLDRVYFIPAYAPPHKKGREDNAEERLQMLEASLKDEDRFIVDTREMEQRERMYTVRTIEGLIEENPEHQVCFILGADSLMQIRTWYRWETFLNMVEIIVCPRPGIDGLMDQVASLREEGYRILVAEGPMVDLSSSVIRRRLEEGKSIRFLVPPVVEDWIEEHGLYGVSERRIDQDFLEGVDAESLDFLNKDPYATMVQRLEKTLKKSRFAHTLRVVKTAVFLARRFGADVEQVRLAALLHDNAKHQEKAYFDLLLERGLADKKDRAPSPIFHAWVGARTAKEIYGVADPAIRHAIMYHPNGSPDMALLDTILFVADKIEPGREYSDVMKMRCIVMEDLYEGALFTLRHNLHYLLDCGAPIDPVSLASFNALLKRVKEARTNTERNESWKKMTLF